MTFIMMREELICSLVRTCATAGYRGMQCAERTVKLVIIHLTTLELHSQAWKTLCLIEIKSSPHS